MFGFKSIQNSGKYIHILQHFEPYRKHQIHRSAFLPAFEFYLYILGVVDPLYYHRLGRHYLNPAFLEIFIFIILYFSCLSIISCKNRIKHPSSTKLMLATIFHVFCFIKMIKMISEKLLFRFENENLCVILNLYI